MDKISQFTTFLRDRYYNNIKAHRILPIEEGVYSDFPDGLHASLQNILQAGGIKSLYGHQISAFQSISSGNDTLMISRTASGKTLSFLLPILNDYISGKQPFTTMLLYPTKALSRDQEGTLGKLMHAVASGRKLGTFDGDTPREEREKLKDNADFIITNPDMLHSGILPNHNRKWKNFLSRLKYVVVDEVHTYRGAFGSHVANVFSRLIRICRLHGANPIFICSSATVGNPSEHVEALFQRSFTVIDNDTSPRPKRDLFFLNPSLYKGIGGEMYRKGPSSLSIPLIRYASENNIRTICFCKARQEVERLYTAVLESAPHLRSKIRPYRGGLLPNERRQIESDLFAGKINTIISTNALELGIDIGDLDLCILSGHPGTLASFWQQAGRVGRKGNGAAIVFIAKDSPIDQYLVNHPEFVTSAPLEEAWLSSHNPYIILQHLPCAAYEYPLQMEESQYAGDTYDFAVDVLVKNLTLKPYHESFRYNLQKYPAMGVNLRGMTDYNVEIFHNGKVIGEIDPISARATLHKDAIYQHLGKRYMSINLDLEKKLCEVEEVNVDYFTEAVWETMIQMTDVDEDKTLNGALLNFGEVNVNKQPKLFKKIKERTNENIGYGPITLPPFIYDTTGLCLYPPKTWLEAVEAVDKRYSEAALYGLSYILKRSAPSLCMADVNDIQTDVSLSATARNEWKSALYLYDAHEGGVGYAEKIYDKISDALTLCLAIIEECECEAGCPSCVTANPTGLENTDLQELLEESNASVACTRSLIQALLTGNFDLPEVILHKQAPPKKVDKVELDPETIKLQKRLNRASSILQKKRDRVY
ncbi:MAG TPA: DEAD/DEAH box helicase [Leptospiraceae bacterium]|nr:DEAD/DEAH box helicase [Leptospiraceae bacterium]HMX30911.1 DEAD/DEAH box helicase [Leptospiraceae bacterium]HMY30015.1 DEAD/DEAH box helicase [Leptospiraceae bacterium]HMZ65347.1 DEAD/DEAH box helicase [Leptospiraceae bacterium]HNA07323.1 DEAD/DEAH box helicase [Leptospiraceae bacterium]